MTLELEWTKQEEFRSQSLREWLVDGQVAGVTRSGGGLTYATISGAGHMVRTLRWTEGSLYLILHQAPYDKPVESLELANRWLAGEEL